MTWLEHEDAFEQLLIDNHIVYRREGEISNRGHESGKGKSDFTILHQQIGAVECKCVDNLSRVNYPRTTTKESLIKTHQLRFCRERNGAILIYDNDSEKYYFMKPTDLDRIIIKNGLVASLKRYISHLEIEHNDIVNKIKGEKIDGYN